MRKLVLVLAAAIAAMGQIPEGGNQGGGGGGDGVGATNVSGLTDLKVTVSSGTVLAIAAGTNVRGNTATAITAATATISAGSGSGTVRVYITEGDVVTVEHPTAAGLTISCSGCTQQQVTTPATPANSRALATVTVVSGAWDTVTDQRGLSSRPITCGTGLTCTDTGGVLTTAIDTADVPRLGATNVFTGTIDASAGALRQPGASGTPGAGACTSAVVGAVYVNTDNGGLAYDCMQTGAATYTWVSRGGSGGSPGGSGTELQYRGGASTFSALTNSSIPNSGELAISTAPNASATRAVFRLGNAISGGDSDGTYIGINHSTGSYAGNFLEFQDNGTRLVTVGKDVVSRIALRGNNYPTGAYEFYTAAGNHSFISGHHLSGILMGHNATTAVDTGYSIRFPREGGVKLETPPGSKPTCDVNARGWFWHAFSGAGVKDTVEVCAKDSGDSYAWRTIY